MARGGWCQDPGPEELGIAAIRLIFFQIPQVSERNP
jgi:hypothetical protein